MQVCSGIDTCRRRAQTAVRAAHRSRSSQLVLLELEPCLLGKISKLRSSSRKSHGLGDESALAVTFEGHRQRDAALRRRAVTKRSSRRVGIHDGAVEARAWEVFCTYKSILRLRGSCPGPTFRWAEQLQGLPQQAAAHCCTCQHAHSSFKDGSQALAALTYINHSS